VKIEVEVIWIVMLCCVMVGYHLQPEDRGRKIFQNIGIILQHYTVSQPSRPRLESSWVWTCWACPAACPSFLMKALENFYAVVFMKLV